MQIAAGVTEVHSYRGLLPRAGEVCLLMAVMTSQHPEGVVFEQKIQPVPSSDKMALDIDING